MTICEQCVHKRICDIWSSQECQDASLFIDDCFEPIGKGNIRWHDASKETPIISEPLLIFAEDDEYGPIIEKGDYHPYAFYDDKTNKLVTAVNYLSDNQYVDWPAARFHNRPIHGVKYWAYITDILTDTIDIQERKQEND